MKSQGNNYYSIDRKTYQFPVSALQAVWKSLQKQTLHRYSKGLAMVPAFKNTAEKWFSLSRKGKNNYESSEVSPALDYLFIAWSSKPFDFNPNLHMRKLRMKSWGIYWRLAREPSGSRGLNLEMPYFLH